MSESFENFTADFEEKFSMLEISLEGTFKEKVDEAVKDLKESLKPA